MSGLLTAAASTVCALTAAKPRAAALLGDGRDVPIRPAGSPSRSPARATPPSEGGRSRRSEASGMRRSNPAGHGFTLSRQAYTLI
ncbi:hypothetical protein [Mycobacterium kyogaense]|uniref:hypothetical protein n=1 Tax=Mycobacterium kyogaense TaxID=2212479 RepID=UPI000DAC3EF9|nr:hypothetical protein [Mycobacterium kyogaense]